MESSSAETPKPKRAPRKRVARTTTRAPRKTVAKKAVHKQAPRKKVAVAPTVTATPFRGAPRVAPQPVSERKAPTPLASNQAAKKRKRNQYLVVLVVLLIGVGASAGVGFTDKGQIDVNQTIEARNERIKNNQADERDTLVSNVVVPVQNTNPKPDGGLVGRGKVEKPKPAPVVASSTATSTDQSATSTTAVASTTEAVANESATSTEEMAEEAPEAEVAPIPGSDR